MDKTDQFAQQATLFEAWILESSTQGQQFAHEAVKHLIQLYLATLELPSHADGGLHHVPDAQGISDEVMHRAADSLRGRLPFDLYGTVFDPQIVPPEESSIGSLADDLLDIYRDVATGLREYERGLPAKAIWEWGFNFQHHWGRHATDAIRALHGWLYHANCGG
jgi:Domain of unknown function (DUF5063)